jgi:acetyl-CoA carboxylase biotin carboxyl carrier protein
MFEETVEHRLRPIAAAFVKSDLVRIRVADERTEIEMRRGAPAARTGAPAGTASDAARGAYELIAAEVVGIVRFAGSWVEEGARVETDQELACVEALGIRNPVRARSPGRLACVYVGDGEPVDYGQPLFAVDHDL